jgi:hypothetical protein
MYQEHELAEYAEAALAEFGFAPGTAEPTPAAVATRVTAAAVRLECAIRFAGEYGDLSRAVAAVAELRRLALALDAWG